MENPPERVTAHEVATAQTPMDMIRLAIERGADVAGLVTLSELAKEWEDRNARKEFNADLAAFQAECPPIRKSKDGPSLSKDGSGRPAYRYAPLDEIARIVRPLLLNRGMTFSWDSATDGQTITVTCVLRHVNGHETRASFSCPTDSPSPKMTGQQKHGGGLSFAQRRSLVSVLGLTTTDEDLDGADAEPVETITEHQAADLVALADEVGADHAKFLKWLGVARYEDIPASRHRAAVAALERKRGA